MDVVVVVHTEGGVSWSSAQFRDMRIVEVRPSIPADNVGVSYFWSNKERLKEWIDLGERDAVTEMSALLETLEGWAGFTTERAKLLLAAKKLGDEDL